MRIRATAWLLFATCLWGLSFPLAKVLALSQLRLLPGVDTWFLTGLSLTIRFGLAAAAVAVASARSLGNLVRLEFKQGCGLGLFSAGGMLLQMDGLNYTNASTSAFLTSCYCVTIPVIVAFQRRRWPPLLVMISCLAAAAGIGILSGLDWETLRLGRGELETILSSFFFAAQIFWLERPIFARNRTAPVSAIMFAVLAVAAFVVVCLRAPNAQTVAVAACGSPSIIGTLLALTILCTLVTFLLMNHWQRHLEATEAGLVYCVEPVWTSGFALFLPSVLAVFAGIHYPNELLSPRLLVGGGLITAANVCIQLRPRAVEPVR